MIYGLYFNRYFGLFNKLTPLTLLQPQPQQPPQ